MTHTNTERWYHGTGSKFDNFSIDFADIGHAKNGPGFYLTASRQEAEQYARLRGGQDGIVMEFKLRMRQRLVPNRISRPAVEN